MNLDRNYLIDELNANISAKLELTSQCFITIDDFCFNSFIFNDLKEIYLNKNNLTKINENTFKGLLNLELLDLSQNSIEFIHPNAFNHLNHLKRLYLNKNAFKSISKHVFTGLRLQELKLFDGIGILNEPLFEQLDNKQEQINTRNLIQILSDTDKKEMILNRDYLLQMYSDMNTLFSQSEIKLYRYICSNRLIQIDVNAFVGLFNLKCLLIQARINQIDPYSFSELKYLVDLSLKGNRIQFIHSQTLEGLVNLKWLDLSENQIESLADNSFVCLTHLQRLDLYDNKLTYLTEHTFNGLSKLEVLNLRKNQIQRIKANTFCFMRNLEYLLIDSNQIEHLNENVFNDLINLKALGLANNKFKSIHKNLFIHLKGLVHLGIFNEFEINSFRFDFECDSINEINVNNFNSFIREAICLNEKYIHDYFNSPVPNKQIELTIKDDDIVNIDANAFKELRSLKYLTINDTLVDCLSKNIMSNLPHTLRELHLNSNKIETIDANTFDNLKNLNYLNISDNNLKALDENLFVCLTKLEVLDLSYNKIEKLNEGTFNGLNNLNILDLQQNEIKSIEKNSFAQLASLIGLNLAENQLQFIDSDTFKSLIKLDDLNLSDNKLKHLSNNTFSGGICNSLTSLNLSNNNLMDLTPNCQLFSCLVNLENLILDSKNGCCSNNSYSNNNRNNGDAVQTAVRVLVFIFLKVNFISY